MPLFSNLKKVFHKSAVDTKRQQTIHHIRKNANPKDLWQIVGELGDGAFGKVYKAQHKEKQILAAAKICELEDEEDLSDFTIEIDILSELGRKCITLIEFAQMEPPHHEMLPMRVLLKIQKSEPPKLNQPEKWSRSFNEFIASCLVKDPQQRPTASRLLEHSFINRVLDSKSIRDLLLEYKAEVVEETLEDAEDALDDVSEGGLSGSHSSRNSSISALGTVKLEGVQNNSDSPSIARKEPHVLMRVKAIHKSSVSLDRLSLDFDSSSESGSLRRREKRRAPAPPIPVSQVDSKMPTNPAEIKSRKPDSDEGKLYDNHVLRKQELRELKVLQAQEHKEFRDLALRAQLARDQLERKFEHDKATLTRQYDIELENTIRAQEMQVERAEQQLETDLRLQSRRIRAVQEVELKQFMEGLKHEMKQMKQDVDHMSKDKRKEAMKTRKDNMEKDQVDREKAFLGKLNDKHEKAMKTINEKHREKIANIKKQFLQKKQQLLRSREAAISELEEKHIHDKHQLATQEDKDTFHLHKQHMLVRHKKEIGQVKRMNVRREEKLLKALEIEKRQLPKRIRAERDARETMYLESRRISGGNILNSEQEKEHLKRFQEQENKRYKAEQERWRSKQLRQSEDTRQVSEAAVKELESAQNEKRRLLMEHEMQKLKQQEEEYNRELSEWRALLKSRKQRLEDEFAKQLAEHEKFYGMSLRSNTPAAQTVELRVPDRPSSGSSGSSALSLQSDSLIP
ncbi:unnamed protein product [Darwinula stevensoni]|uniref:Protein kinase domain-containing protein n=1 Tax=Darwinula stevensoni TaxID=69355 RepID=A0A7R8XEM7_9CRUS|nr:unnamed protein product [Darwinula stevensoni]CAG0894161.1 unnamed protein product [Darwinula stevensoni]